MTKTDARDEDAGDAAGAEEPDAAADNAADLKATVQLSGEALAALLEEVRNAQNKARGPGEATSETADGEPGPGEEP